MCWLARPVGLFLNHIVTARSIYQKVFDDRKRRVRGLWKRHDHFYARLVIVDDASGHRATKRVRLEKARVFAEARTALQDLQKDRREENLPVLKRSPKLKEYGENYFKFYESSRRWHLDRQGVWPPLE